MHMYMKKGSGFSHLSMAFIGPDFDEIFYTDAMGTATQLVYFQEMIVGFGNLGRARVT